MPVPQSLNTRTSFFGIRGGGSEEIANHLPRQAFAERDTGGEEKC